MLVISRQRGETVMIGDDIEVTVMDFHEEKIRLGVNAPKELSVHRKEVYDAIRRENQAARQVPEPPPQDEDLFQLRPDRLASKRERRPIDPSIKLRPATEVDLGSINDIYNHYVAHSTCTYQEQPEPIEGRETWFAGHGVKHPVTVATIDGKVSGWGSLSAYQSRSAYRHTVENSVYVHHEFHRRGIGSAILEDLIERGRLLGHRAIIAGIDGEQPASIRLHLKFGFEQVGHMKQVGFKFGRWLDVTYMQLIL
jgi:phosphinothricin acetyltransferase